MLLAAANEALIRWSHAEMKSRLQKSGEQISQTFPKTPTQSEVTLGNLSCRLLRDLHVFSHMHSSLRPGNGL